MSKTFTTSLIIAVGVLGAASLARAEGADGPSFPALGPIQSVLDRADVQAMARFPDVQGTALQLQPSADGGANPALEARFGGRRRRADVRAEVRAASTGNAPSIVIEQGRYGA